MSISTSRPDYSRLGPNLNDKILVIGGCGGIGFATVSAAVETGLSVIVMDLESSISATEFPDGVQTIPIDLRCEAEILKAFEALDALDIILNHVVFASGYTAELLAVKDMERDVLDDVMRGNLTGQVFAARECAKRVSQGHFVFISTAIGQVGAPGYAPYGMAKAGLNALTRILAAELAPNIRVNGIAPGPIDTPFIRGGLGRGVSDVKAAKDIPLRFDRAAFEARTPLGRLGVAEDIAGPILFLLSEAARYITGQVLHVNGGSFMRD